MLEERILSKLTDQSFMMDVLIWVCGAVADATTPIAVSVGIVTMHNAVHTIKEAEAVGGRAPAPCTRDG